MSQLNSSVRLKRRGVQASYQCPYYKTAEATPTRSFMFYVFI